MGGAGDGKSQPSLNVLTAAAAAAVVDFTALVSGLSPYSFRLCVCASFSRMTEMSTFLPLMLPYCCRSLALSLSAVFVYSFH